MSRVKVVECNKFRMCLLYRENGVPASLDVWYYNCFFVQLVQQMDAGFPKNDLERRSGKGRGIRQRKCS
jgi:hypothetical protein